MALLDTGALEELDTNSADDDDTPAEEDDPAGSDDPVLPPVLLGREDPVVEEEPPPAELLVPAAVDEEPAACEEPDVPELELAAPPSGSPGGVGQPNSNSGSANSARCRLGCMLPGYSARAVARTPVSDPRCPWQTPRGYPARR